MYEINGIYYESHKVTLILLINLYVCFAFITLIFSNSVNLLGSITIMNTNGI